MRTPVSVVVRNIDKQNVEELVFATYTKTLQTGYSSDDTFIHCCTKRRDPNLSQAFQQTKPGIKSTGEVEGESKICHLYFSVNHDNNKLKTTVWQITRPRSHSAISCFTR